MVYVIMIYSFSMKALPKPIAFEWNAGNTDKNWHKHKVETKEIEEIFANKPLRLFPDLTHSHKEQRFLALGQTNTNRLLSAIFTIRNNKIRVISARDQSKKDRRVYEETT